MLKRGDQTDWLEGKRKVPHFADFVQKDGLRALCETRSGEAGKMAALSTYFLAAP